MTSTSLRTPKIFETPFAVYTATEILGEGGSGKVFLATDQDNTTCAVKLLDGSKATKVRLKRFKNEYLFGLRNSHPHILTVVDHGLFVEESRSSPFYVMAHHPRSLADLISGSLASAQVLEIYAGVLSGVEAAHLQSVTHRDLKPENILIDVQGQPIIADFGIARFEKDDLLTEVETKPGDRLANFLYAAPEQKIRNGLVDQRADIYALGLILNQMFTKSVPLGTSYHNIASIDPQFAYVDVVVEKMLRQNPDERPQSVQEVKSLLSNGYDLFATRQRLSELLNTIVPAAEIDDPLVLNPVELIDVDFNSGQLILILNHSVNPAWVEAFSNIGNYQFISGYEPRAFNFRENTARIRVDGHENSVQQLVDFFKSWLPNATQAYTNILRAKKAREQEEIEASLRKKRQDLHLREQIIQNIRI